MTLAGVGLGKKEIEKASVNIEDVIQDAIADEIKEPHERPWMNWRTAVLLVAGLILVALFRYLH